MASPRKLRWHVFMVELKIILLQISAVLIVPQTHSQFQKSEIKVQNIQFDSEIIELIKKITQLETQRSSDINSFKLDTTRHLPDVWFMSDSGLNWLQQLSDCWPSICRGQSKLQLLRGSRRPSLLQSSADKSNLSPHFPQPCQHGKRLAISGAISPEIELKWFMSHGHGMQDSWLHGDECLWSQRKQRMFFVGMKMKVKHIWMRKMYDLIFFSPC